MHWLELVIDRQPADPDAMRLIATGFDTWLKSNGAIPLARCFSLPVNPERARIAIRDHHLRAAGMLVQGSTVWKRAGALSAECARFEGRKWVVWFGMSAPPAHATEIERALWFAMRASGGRLPKTQRQYFNILREL